MKKKKTSKKKKKWGEKVKSHSCTEKKERHEKQKRNTKGE